MTTNRLCIDCGAWLNSDDLDLNPAGLWCVRHELARRVEAERGFATPMIHATPGPESQVRFGNQDRGLPWQASTVDPHDYLRKPLPPLDGPRFEVHKIAPETWAI
jgi:hypothetical protein